MSILWCGGEPVDFPVSPNGLRIDRGQGFRSAFCRCAITPIPRSFNSTDYAKSNPIAGAPFSNVWLSFFMCHNNDNRSSYTGYCGLVDSNQTGLVAPGIWLYQSDGNGTVRLGWLNTSGTMTSLVQSSQSVVPTNTPVKFDIQFSGVGTASTTIVLYRGGVQFMYWQGDSSGWGFSLDAVAVGWYNNSFNNNWNGDTQNSAHLMSEIILADESTLPIQGLQSLSVISSDVTPAWGMEKTSNINKIVPQDSTCAAVSTTGNDLQIDIPFMPTGLYQVKAVKISARAIKGSTSTVSNLKLGFNKSNRFFIQSNTYWDNWSSINFLSPVTSGNFLIVGMVTRGSNLSGVTVSDSLGTVYTKFSTYNTLFQYSSLSLWYGIAPSSGNNTVTFASGPNNFTRTFCMEFNGVSAASMDAHNVIYAGRQQTVQLTTTQKDLVLVIGTNSGGMAGWNTGNGENNVSDWGDGGYFPIENGARDTLIVGFTVADAAPHSFYLDMWNDSNNAVYAVAFPVTWPTGTVYVGSSQAVSTAFGTAEQLFNSDPTNSNAAFGNNLNGYQIDIQSA